MALDGLAGIIAIMVAFVVRFTFDGRPIPESYVLLYLKLLPIVVPVRIALHYMFGLYRQIWSHASVPELLRVLGAVTIESLVTAAIILPVASTTGVGFPRSVIAIGWLLKVATLGSIRLVLRLRHDRQRSTKVADRLGSRTLIFGAGDAGAMLARELVKHPELGVSLLGFIDDDLNKQGHNFAGKPVLGTRKQLRAIADAHQITNLIVATPSTTGSVIRDVMEDARTIGLQIKTIPGIFELVSGSVSVTEIRDIQIEDILGRDEVILDMDAIAAYLTGEVVLVTGAGGSIGSELCRQVARFRPSQLVLLGHGENSIYEVHRELIHRYAGLIVHPVIADIQDEGRMNNVFHRFRPSVVFHAAAHKHVPLMEHNPQEAIKNNVFGTLNVAKAAYLCEAKRFVLISSDKAVNPTSVMGATKRIAESIIESMAQVSKTRFVAVRFGNVLGSRGSVVPLFKQQIAEGGPVTVTDPRMERYFMTIPEAAQLVVQAGAMGTGGEIFVLDMGNPVRIIDLARDMIRLSGFEPEIDIPITYVGVRDGEKLFEELLTAEEGTVATRHERIFVARAEATSSAALKEVLDAFSDLVQSSDVTGSQVLSLLEAIRQRGGHARTVVGYGG